MNDPWNADRTDELPDGSFILVPEIQKALEGKPFRYFPKQKSEVERVGSVVVEPVDTIVYYYYLNVFHNCELWGLPHGSGWANELPWLLTFLTIMKKYKYEIEAWHHRKAAQKWQQSS